MRLILLRHTQTAVGNLLCYGDTDVALAATSELDIRTAISRLPMFNHVLTSPLERCLTLANAAARARDITVEVDRDLQEMNFGRWQGQRWDDIPRKELDAWAEDYESARPHGGDSVKGFRSRVQRVLSSIEQRYSPEASILVVTHAGVIRSAMTLVDRKQNGGGDERDLDIDYGHWCQIEISKEGIE